MDWVKIGFGAVLGALASVLLTLWLIEKPDPRPEVRIAWVTMPKEVISQLMGGSYTSFASRVRGYDIQISNTTNYRTKPIEVAGERTIYGRITITTVGNTRSITQTTNWNSVKLDALGPGDSARLFLVSEAYDEIPFKILNGDVVIQPVIATASERPTLTSEKWEPWFLGFFGLAAAILIGGGVWAYSNRNNMAFWVKHTSKSDLERYARITDYVRQNQTGKLPEDLRKPPDELTKPQGDAKT